MNDKQIFVSIVGGLIFGIVGGLLVIPIRWLLHSNDGGDDLGWGVLWLGLMIVSTIVGFILTSQWSRKRYSDFQT